MDLLEKFFLGVRILGPANSLRAVVYALERRRIEDRHPPSQNGPDGEPTSPGDATRTPQGLRVRFGDLSLEVQFLEAACVRVTWTPGRRPPPYAWADPGVPSQPPEVDVTEDGAGWTLGTDRLEVRILRDGSIHYRALADPAGTSKAAHRTLRREAPPARSGGAWSRRADLHPGAHVYGLGERAASLDLRGSGERPATYRLWNTEVAGSYGRGVDPLYLSIPVYQVLDPGGGYLLFHNNSHDGEVTFGDDETVRFAGGALCQVIALGRPPEALATFGRLTGRPPLPPRWALGFHQSRWGYRSEADIRRVVDGFKEHRLPLDVVHLDIDYMRGFRVFTVDPESFPDLPGLASDLREQGIRLVSILDPGVKQDGDWDLYEDGRRRGVFCRLPDGAEGRAPVWPGWCAFPDFTDPAARAWWGELYPKLLEAGIAGFWHDMNEPAGFSAFGDPTLPLPLRHSLEGRGGDHREAHNLYGLQMARAGHDALRRLRPDRRPFLLTRSGWLGVQRYAWTWTGDVECTWSALRTTLSTVLGLGLSGAPWTGPDIGGFSGAPDAELFVRWLQAAALMPFCRNHAYRLAPPREPWEFGEPALSITRDMLGLRRRLLPYLYTLAYEASVESTPLLRPLFWHNLEDVDLWGIDDAFLVGRDLLVAPILEAGKQRRRVRLPAGRWYDVWTDRCFEGGQDVELEGPLERLPILARAGAVIPVAPHDGAADGNPAGETGGITLHLWPPDGDGAVVSQLYDDAGDGYGDHRLELFRVARTGDGFTVDRGVSGQYPAPASYGLRPRSMGAVVVEADGRPCPQQPGGGFRVPPFRRLDIRPAPGSA
ncbi:MAG: glycoside hydrolase family 31 protein [Acidobacteriota bacterium]